MENGVRKREWVKTAAIILLAVLLVLDLAVLAIGVVCGAGGGGRGGGGGGRVLLDPDPLDGTVCGIGTASGQHVVLTIETMK